jgi:hypothetical protein
MVLATTLSFHAIKTVRNTRMEQFIFKQDRVHMSARYVAL